MFVLLVNPLIITFIKCSMESLKSALHYSNLKVFYHAWVDKYDNKYNKQIKIEKIIYLLLLNTCKQMIK